MQVIEMIDILSKLDPDSNIFIMSQPNWPFEYRIAGVAKRSDFEEVDDKSSSNDIFICEGQQICYGNNKAWDVLL